MTDKEYQDEETLRRLYHEEEMTQPEIAEKYDVVKSAICYQMKKYGIKARENADAQRKELRKKPAPLAQKDGYRRWSDQYGREKGWKKDVVYVHRLVYVAHHGFEAARDMDIHHKNEMKLDNRPENLEALTRSEHASLHNLGNPKRAESLV